MSFCCKPLKTDRFQGLIWQNNLGGGNHKSIFLPWYWGFGVVLSQSNKGSRTVASGTTTLWRFPIDRIDLIK